MTTKWIKIISYKDFAATVMDPTKETFVIYIVFLDLSLKISNHLAQIAEIVLLVAK